MTDIEILNIYYLIGIFVPLYILYKEYKKGNGSTLIDIIGNIFILVF